MDLFQLSRITDSHSLTVDEKDYKRMYDLIAKVDDVTKLSRHSEAQASKIKDPLKAAARYVAGIKMAQLYYGSNFDYSSDFYPFKKKAIELGSSEEDIDKMLEEAKVPESLKVYADEKSENDKKNRKGYFVGAVVKWLNKQDFDWEFVKEAGNALTMPGKEAMSRNGRKWTMGYAIKVSKDGKEGIIEFDIITDEGGGSNQYAMGLRRYSSLRDFTRDLLNRIESRLS